LEFTTVYGINQALGASGTRINFLLLNLFFKIFLSTLLKVVKFLFVDVQQDYILYKLNAITNTGSIIFLAVYFQFFKLASKCPVYQTQERFHAK